MWTKNYIISCYASIIWRYATGRAAEIAEIFKDLMEAKIQSEVTMNKDANLEYKSQVIKTTLIDDTKWQETVQIEIAGKSVTAKNTYELELFLARI